MSPSDTMTVIIKHQNPIDLLDFSNAMLALSDQYVRVMAQQSVMIPEDARLYIRGVEKSSILADLVAMAPATLGFMSDLNTTVQFAGYLKDSFGYFKDQEGSKPSADRKDLTNLHNILTPIAKDRSAQINICAETVNLNIDSLSANAVQNAIQRELEAMKEPVAGLHRGVLLRLHQMRDAKSRAGDMGIVEGISKRPVRLRFASESLKAKVVGGDGNPFLSAYLVDVRAETIDDRPVMYMVMDIMESIPLNDL